MALIALYAVTRTTGIPLFGPEAGRIEGVAPIDLVAKALEVAQTACLLILLRRAKSV